MAFIYTNPNPKKKHTGDCSVRAVSIALGIDWDHAYDLLYKYVKSMGDMENATVVINKLLTNNGFVRKSIPDTCPSCYTIWDFCEDHPAGTYVLSTGSPKSTPAASSVMKFASATGGQYLSTESVWKRS